MNYQVGIILGACPGTGSIISYYSQSHLNTKHNINTVHTTSNSEIYMQILIFLLIFCYQKDLFQLQSYLSLKYDVSIDVYYGYFIGIISTCTCKLLLHGFNQSYESDFKEFKDNQNLIWNDNLTGSDGDLSISKMNDKEACSNSNDNKDSEHIVVSSSSRSIDNNDLLSTTPTDDKISIPSPIKESISDITSKTMITSNQSSTDRIVVESVDLATTATTSNSIPISQLKVLAKISNLMNIDQEQLAYEITLEPSYQLPNYVTKRLIDIEGNLRNSTVSLEDQTKGIAVSEGTNTIAGGTDNLDSITQLLRTKMLRTINDKLVNSIRRSTVDNIKQLEVGMIVPVRFRANEHRDPTAAPILSAKILALYHNPPSLANDTTSTTIIGTTVPTESIIATATETATTVVSTKVISVYKCMDVEYICDGLKEKNVNIASRIVLSTDKPDPSMMILALEDLCHQIASLTPNRLDIQQNIMKAIDLSLLQQMLINRAVNPKKDLLPIFRYFQNTLKTLQAPSRMIATDRWIQQLAVSFEGKSLDEVAPLIPQFFERSSTVIEEIELDMANYYITLIAPTLQIHGYEYLHLQFQRRAQAGKTSLDALASIIFAQLTPENNFKETVKDFIEAEICGSVVNNNNGGIELPEVLVSTSVRIFPEDILPHNNIKPLYSTAIMARVFISMLQLPFRLDTQEGMYVLPETFHFDAKRLSLMRDIIDRIALESSIMITTRQLLAKYLIPPWCIDNNLEIELQHRLDILLSQNDVNMSSLTIEVVRYIQQCYQKLKNHPIKNNPTSIPTQQAISSLDVLNNQDIHEKVLKALKDTISKDNAVLNLFTKRIYKLLFRAILGQNYLPLLPSYSLQSPAHQKNISTLLINASKLFKHNVCIHRDLYCDIIAQACSTGIMVNNNNTVER